MQIFKRLPYENSPEQPRNKMTITQVEHFLKTGILCHCKEKRKPMLPVVISILGDGHNFNQIDIEGEAKSAQNKKIISKQSHISKDRFEI